MTVRALVALGSTGGIAVAVLVAGYLRHRRRIAWEALPLGQQVTEWYEQHPQIPPLQLPIVRELKAVKERRFPNNARAAGRVERFKSRVK